MNTIPLTVLVEANEVLKMLRAFAPAGTYMRSLDAQLRLESSIAPLLAAQQVEVAV